MYLIVMYIKYVDIVTGEFSSSTGEGGVKGDGGVSSFSQLGETFCQGMRESHNIHVFYIHCNMHTDI